MVAVLMEVVFIVMVDSVGRGRRTSTRGMIVLFWSSW